MTLTLVILTSFAVSLGVALLVGRFVRHCEQLDYPTIPLESPWHASNDATDVDQGAQLSALTRSVMRPRLVKRDES